MAMRTSLVYHRGSTDSQSANRDGERSEPPPWGARQQTRVNPSAALGGVARSLAKASAWRHVPQLRWVATPDASLRPRHGVAYV